MAEKSMPTLRKGDTGSAVKALQRLLGGIEADGIFGSKTEAATEARQCAAGLMVDGVCGKNTWAALTDGDNVATYTDKTATLNGKTVTIWNQHKRSGTYKTQLSEHGCGHCVCAMAAVLAGVSTTPEKVMALAVKKWGEPEDDHWTLSGQGMETLLKSCGVSSDYQLVTEDNLIRTKAAIKTALKAGQPVACWTDDNGLDGDPFASGNHWVLAVGYDADGKIVVANSGNKGPVNLVTLDTLTKFLRADCVGGATGWYTSVKKSAGIVILE